METAGPPQTRKVAKRALFLFALFASGNALFLASTPDLDLGGKVIQFLIGCMFELPAAFAAVYLERRLFGWWRPRATDRSDTAPYAAAHTPAAAFHYSGRRWERPIGALFAMTVFLAFAYLIRDSPDPYLRSFAVLFALFAIFSIALLVPATIQGGRLMTYDVDDVGARIRRWPRAFEVRWEQIGRVEVARPQLPSFVLEDQSRLPRTYALRTREGFIAGTMIPTAELGQGEGRRLEAALVGIATRHGISVVEVPWRGVRAWRKQRLSSRA